MREDAYEYRRLGASASRRSALLPAAELQLQLIRRDGRFPFVCGAFSIMLAVVCAVVIAVIVDRAPQIFMNMGEVYMGQNDLQLFSTISTLNYTLVSQVLAPHVREVLLRALNEQGPRYQLHSPRYQMTSTAYAASRCAKTELDPWDPQWKYNTSNGCVEYEVVEYIDWECGMNTSFTIVTSSDCFDYFCKQSGRGGCRFNLIDTELEGAMGYGREWNLPALGPNEVYVDFRVAQSLGVTENDVIYVRISPFEFGNIFLLPDYASIWYTARVKSVISSPMGKSAFTDTDPLIFAEYKHFLPSLAGQLGSVFDVSVLETTNLYEYARIVKMNMLADERVVAYEQTDFAAMAMHVYGWAGQVCYFLGITTIDPDVPIMYAMRDLEWAAIGFKILLLLVTSTQFMLCILVIYALLSSYRETRSRDSAIMRMVGLPRYAMSAVIGMQTLFHSVPGWLLGLGLSIVVLHYAFAVFSKLTGLHLSFGLSPFAILVSCVYGLVVPALVSTVIVLSAMHASIVDGLRLQRSVQAIVYTVARASDSLSAWSWLIVVGGAACVVEGFALLYTVPLGFLTGNYALLVFVFVAILMGTLIGLALLATAIQPVVEKVLVYFYLWDSATVRTLTSRHLSIHRPHNRLTAVCIAVGVSMVVFISSVANAQLGSVDLRQRQAAGAPISIPLYGRTFTDATVSCIETVIGNHSELVEGSSWCSVGMHVTLSTDGRQYSQGVTAYVLPSDFYASQYTELLRITEPSDAPISELLDDLYAAPTSGMIVGAELSSADTMDLAISSTALTSGDTSLFYSVAGMLSSSTLFTFSSNPASRSRDIILSLPAYMRLQGNNSLISAEDLPLNAWYLRLHSKVTSTERRCFLRHLAACGVSPQDFEQRWFSLLAALQYVSFAAIFIVVSICLSSLVSGTIVNVHQQSAEIGLLQALGLTRWQLYRTYVYETATSVFVAGLLGAGIGVGMSWLIVAQQRILQGHPVEFALPTSELTALLICSVAASILAVVGPVRSMLSRSIVTLLRGG